MKYDLLIQNGIIVDGTGALPVSGDIAVKDGRIAEMGRLSMADAKKVYDARGRVVCPGLIDAHAHSERGLLSEPNRTAKLSQGITLELTGQCGESVFPSHETNGGGFADLAAYRARAMAHGFSVSQGLLVGHGTLREYALGEGDVPLDETGARRMADALSHALAQGALGMSSGLEYAPGMYADEEELIPLARCLARAGAVYATHMRSEGNALLDAVDETLSLTRQSGVTTVISHIKACGKPNHGKVACVLSKMEEARRAGFSVYGDAYPYTAGCTGLSILLPSWTKAGGHGELMRILSDKAGREEIRRWFSFGLDVWENRTILTGWENLYIAGVQRAENARFVGKNLRTLATMCGRNETDAFLDLLLAENGDVDGILFSACEEDVKAALSDPQVMVCSDSVDVSGKPHPRLYGSHVRYLAEYADLASDQGLAEAIYKMTGLVKKVYRLKDVGALAVGMRADITVLDPGSLRDLATYEEPTRLAEGIDAVFVGGEAAYLDGEVMGTRTGIFVRAEKEERRLEGDL